MRTSRAQITSIGGIKDVRGLFNVQPSQLHASTSGAETAVDIADMLCHGCRSTVMDMQPTTLHLPSTASTVRHLLRCVILYSC
jgi:hypothetical protein